MNFFHKPSDKEIMRQNDRQLRSVNRDLSSDLRQLERREKELEAQIKALAKAGHKDACTLLARQLVQLRKQKTKNISLMSTVTSTGVKNRQVNSMSTMSKALGTTAQTMKTVNQRIPLDQFAKIMDEFSKESSRMDMKSDMIEETLDSMLDTEDGEEDKIIGEVLDEIGIEMNAKLSNATRVNDSLPSIAEKSKSSTTGVDIEQMLSDLRK